MPNRYPATFLYTRVSDEASVRSWANTMLLDLNTWSAPRPLSVSPRTAIVSCASKSRIS